MDAAYFENALLDIDLPGPAQPEPDKPEMTPTNLEAKLGDGDPTVLNWARAM